MPDEERDDGRRSSTPSPCAKELRALGVCSLVLFGLWSEGTAHAENYVNLFYEFEEDAGACSRFRNG